MLTSKLQSRIRHEVASFWQSRAGDLDSSVTECRDVGRHLAHLVRDATSALIQQHFDYAYERGDDGQPIADSVGDIWIGEDGLHHPMSVRATVVGSEDQVALTSLQKLATALCVPSIDSYWLLLVEIDLSRPLPGVHVELVDVLDYLDFIGCDPGTARLVLQVSKFVVARAAGHQGARRNSDEVLQVLLRLLEEADLRLVEIQRQARDELRSSIEARTARDRGVSPGRRPTSLR